MLNRLDVQFSMAKLRVVVMKLNENMNHDQIVN